MEIVMKLSKVLIIVQILLLIISLTSCNKAPQVIDGTTQDPAATTDISTENTDDMGQEESIPFSLDIKTTSTIFGPTSAASKISPSYGTITLLERSDPKKRTLLATMNAGSAVIGGKTGFCYKILKSTTGGKTWSYCGYAEDDFNTAIGATYSVSTPHLYELPEDLGNFKAGTVFLAGVSKDAVKTSELTVTAITLFYSTDAGSTWKAFATLDTAGGKGEGVWEPFLIYDDGKLFCFYSDDSDPMHDQKIVYKWTSDLVNWHGADGAQDCTVKPTAQTKYGEPYEAVACRSQKFRPGMASIAKMNNGQFILCFEIVGISGSPIYCKTTDSLLDWGDVSDYGEKVVQFGNTPGAAPWIAYSPKGGDCGVLFLAAHHNASGNPKYTEGSTDLFLSFDYGKTWIRTVNPLPHTIASGKTASDTEYYRGYSPAMVVSSDGETLYYANMTEYSKNTELTELSFARINISGNYIVSGISHQNNQTEN